MTIHVSKDVESSINAAVQSGRYSSADDTPQESSDQWADRLQAWVNTHPSRLITIDDSRESIYAGRGE
jgi:Arc/MetJ-type ribon-helix-helix transcriptional regulator